MVSRSATIRLAVVMLWAVGCKSYNPSARGGTFDPCCGNAGICVPSGALPAALAPRLAPDTCGPALLCAPALLVNDPSAALPACRAAGNLEGRCLSRCLPEVEQRADQLTQETCAGGEVCVPCFDPFTGDELGVCSFGGDPGPQEPARVFGKCCEAHGRCLPAPLVPPENLKQFGRDTCAEPASLCLPEAWLPPATPAPRVCRGAGEIEGRCLLSCLPAVAGQADRLQKANCGDSELCVPCADPLTGEDTEVCRIGSDRGPSGPPRVFGRCCGGAARCVPRELVPADASKQLKPLDCERAILELCVPEAWLDDPAPPPASCRAPGGYEGRCLLGCLLGEDGEQLQQTSCAAGELCAPCFNPLTGESTGSCEIGEDPGPLEPAREFGRCCGGSARCVPRELVPAPGGEQLSKLDCEGDGEVCVPEPWLASDEPPVPASCRAPGDLEGRCLPSCLLGDQASALQQGSCASAEVCAPCFDPRTGEDTSSCRIGSDPGPLEPATVFGQCCDSRARCVPRELVPGDAGDQLRPLDCESDQDVCVPEDWLDAAAPPAVSCRAPGNLEGRCIPDCLVADQPGLTQASCGTGEVCAPCYDPRSGADTQICSQRGDAPAEPPRGFTSCCGMEGTCVPVELLTADQRTQLPVESCTGYQARCVPTPLLAGDFESLACGEDGVCLATCFVGTVAALLLPDCQTDKQCVPCSQVGCE